MSLKLFCAFTAISFFSLTVHERSKRNDDNYDTILRINRIEEYMEGDKKFRDEKMKKLEKEKLESLEIKNLLRDIDYYKKSIINYEIEKKELQGFLNA